MNLLSIKANYEMISRLKEWEKDKIIKYIIRNVEDFDVNTELEEVNKINLEVIGKLTVDTLRLEGLITVSE